MRVFLDSNIIQHAATTYRTCDIYFGGAKPGEPLIRKGPIETVQKLPAENESLRAEIASLSILSLKLKEIGAHLMIDHENNREIKRAGRFRTEYFHGANIVYAERPPEFNTLLACPDWMNPGPTNNQFHNFLHGLKDTRFLELAKYAGALQGENPNYNQLADAYFLWCAETNMADYFLTLDFRLIRCIQNAKRLNYKPKIVSASQLLAELSRA